MKIDYAGCPARLLPEDAPESLRSQACRSCMNLTCSSRVDGKWARRMLYALLIFTFCFVAGAILFIRLVG